MKDRLSLKKLLSLSMMLFALFFGAGNMIFPPAMGQAAGTNVWIALAGFIFTDVAFVVLQGEVWKEKKRGSRSYERQIII